MMKIIDRIIYRGPAPNGFYFTGSSLKARWFRFRLNRSYRRPVTYSDLRKIAHDFAYRDRDLHRPDPVGEALMGLVIRQAEMKNFLRR